MPAWLGSAIVLTVVAALIGAVTISHIRAKKRGKGGCACGCEHCAARCHMNEKNEKEP